jgi:arylsulfatase A-like enzyme
MNLLHEPLMGFSAHVMAVFIFLSSLGCAPDDLKRSTSKPNVLLVALDTVRADHLQVYGYSRPTSPHLSARAKDWFIFENAQSSAPWTAPALISLMTSLYPNVHGIHAFPNPGRLGGSVTTLAEILREHGYVTAAFTEGGYAKGAFGLDRGFDHYPSNPGDEETNHSNLLHPSRLVLNLDRTLSWIRDHQHEAFFVFHHTYEPHTPYRAPESVISQFRPDYDEAVEHRRVREAIRRWNVDRTIDEQEMELVRIHQYHCRLNDMPRLLRQRRFAALSRKRGLDHNGLADRRGVVRVLTDFHDAEIALVDQELDRIWTFLEDSRLLEHTIVVLLSDHGEGLGEHGAVEHGKSLFEELLHIPLMIYAPDPSLVARRIPSLVRSVDVMPTVLDLVGISAADRLLQGQSLVPLMRGEHRELLSFSHARDDVPSQFSVRDDRWRLIRDNVTRETALYDLEHDPDELHPVTHQHPEIAARLEIELDRQMWRDQALKKASGADVQAIDLDSKTVDELRRLGYIE